MARPREFEPEEALQKAMLQFWSSGYHDTSIKDLTARTGVFQYGLYGTFKSKHGLYIASLDHYRNTVTQDVLQVLAQNGPARKAVEAAFRRLLDHMRTEDGPVGCLIANAALEVAPSDEETAAKVRAHMALLRKAFLTRLERSVSDGELGPNKDIAALSEFLATTAYSLGFLLRAGCNNEVIDRHVHTALGTLA